MRPIPNMRADKALSGSFLGVSTLQTAQQAQKSQKGEQVVWFEPGEAAMRGRFVHRGAPSIT